MPGPRITCLSCGDIIRSEHRHDWRACSCFKNEEGNEGCYIDGGKDYTRVGGANWKFTAEPCPFCGSLSNLEIVQVSIDYTTVGQTVKCEDCGAQGPVNLPEPVKATWNTWNERSDK